MGVDKNVKEAKKKFPFLLLWFFLYFYFKFRFLIWAFDLITFDFDIFIKNKSDVIIQRAASSTNLLSYAPNEAY